MRGAAGAASLIAPHGINRDGSIRGQNKVEPLPQTDHWVTWYRRMRDGKTPNAPIDAGCQHAVASIIATMSYETGRPVRCDSVTRTIYADCPGAHAARRPGRPRAAMSRLAFTYV